MKKVLYTDNGLLANLTLPKLANFLLMISTQTAENAGNPDNYRDTTKYKNMGQTPPADSHLLFLYIYSRGTIMKS
ncbi:hypothetical protein JYU16_01465 [bacterium AH-315-M05]|nr:hypothetical protein [bacterium AH-315-M05]